MSIAEKLAKSLGLTVKECLAEGGGALGVCDYESNAILLAPGLTPRMREHVILHEIAHYTGVESLLNRFTLANYASQEVFALVEELVAEMSAIALVTVKDKQFDTRMAKALIQRADQEGVDLEEDVYPEVEKVLAFLEPYVKGVVNG